MTNQIPKETKEFQRICTNSDPPAGLNPNSNPAFLRGRPVDQQPSPQNISSQQPSIEFIAHEALGAQDQAPALGHASPSGAIIPQSIEKPDPYSAEGQEQISQELDEWAQGAQEGEQRDEAVRQIKNALSSRSGNLRLVGLGLRELPSCIGKLQALRTLSLQQNELKSLPESIGDLQTLQALYLYDNQLGSLPSGMVNLKALKLLLLGNNRLKTLPDGIGGLQDLKLLRLGENQLTRLPNSIGELQALLMLDLDNNPLESFPTMIHRLNVDCAVMNLQVGQTLFLSRKEYEDAFKAQSGRATKAARRE